MRSSPAAARSSLPFGFVTPLLGLAVAFAASAAAMQWMVDYVSRHGLEVFGWYHILIAAVTAGLLTACWL